MVTRHKGNRKQYEHKKTGLELLELGTKRKRECYCGEVKWVYLVECGTRADHRMFICKDCLKNMSLRDRLQIPQIKEGKLKEPIKDWGGRYNGKV